MALIYHYCSPYTFQQIVERKCFWLSSTNNLNDFAEGEWFASALKQALSKMENEYGKVWCQEAWQHFTINLRPKYITCFSKNNDSLSQWRAYAKDGEGLAIGFDDEQFGARGEIVHSNIDPQQSLCVQDVQYKNIDEVSNEIIDHAKKIKKLDTEDKFPSQFHLATYCTSLAMSIKNPAFKEENERRLIYSALLMTKEIDRSVEVANPIGDIKHRIASGYLTSYFEMNFAPEKAIKDIVLGPKNKFSNYDIGHFLGLNGLGHVPFWRSSATYR